MKSIVFAKEHFTHLGIVRSLGEGGINPYVIVLKNKSRITSKSKYIKELYIVNSLQEGYQLLIDKFGKDQKDIIFTGDDEITAFLDSNYDELSKHFIFYNAGQKDRISYYMDKININILAEECGLSVPKSVVVKKGSIPDNIEYPIITKAMSPNSGGWKDDVFICNNSDELIAAYPKIKSEKVILQQYIDKENELCLDGFSYNQGNELFISIASSYDYLLEDTFSYKMTVTNFEKVEGYKELEISLKEMFHKIGFEGIFSIEFLKTNDKYYFMEINFRDSTWSYASTVAGMNLLILWKKAMTEEFDAKDYYRSIKDNYHAMAEVPDFAYRVLKRRITFFQWLKERKSCECLFFKNKKDKRPYYSCLCSHFKYRVFRLFKRKMR